MAKYNAFSCSTDGDHVNDLHFTLAHRCAVALAERGQAWCLASLFALGLDPACQHPDSGKGLLYLPLDRRTLATASRWCLEKQDLNKG